MRLSISESGLNVKSAKAWFLTFVSMAIPLGFLSGCGEQTPSTSGNGNQSGRVGELQYVTDDELARFVDGTPDNSVKFPEEDFVAGRKLLLESKFAESEKAMKDGLDAAVKSSAGQTKLGQYCVRLNNPLYYEHKYKEALKYGILAGRIFYKQPPAQRPMPMWFFNVHMHQGFCYKYMGIYPEAELQLRKAINVAASAPSGQVDWGFHRLCYIELIDTLIKDKKKAETKKVQEELKNLEAQHK